MTCFWPRGEAVNIYPQPNVVEKVIVLGLTNSRPGSAISDKREGVKSVCTRYNSLLACNYGDRTHHCAALRCCMTFFSPWPCHKVGGYTLQKNH